MCIHHSRASGEENHWVMTKRAIGMEMSLLLHAPRISGNDVEDKREAVELAEPCNCRTSGDVDRLNEQVSQWMSRLRVLRYVRNANLDDL